MRHIYVVYIVLALIPVALWFSMELDARRHSAIERKRRSRTWR